MNEASMWQIVKKLLKGTDPVRVENPACPGTPDINCTLGWIELKRVEEYPKREDTIIRIPHFTGEQRAWLMRRWAADKKAWLLISIVDDWYLFTGRKAAEKVGRSNKSELIQHCAMFRSGQVPERDDLTFHLRYPYEA